MQVNTTEKTNVSYRFLAENQCKTIFDAVLSVLSRTGCTVSSAKARQLMADAGCHVDGERVYIPASVTQKAIASAPRQIILYNRNGSPAMVLGSNNTYYGPGPTNPSVVDHENGEKRPATRADMAAAARVIEALPYVSWATGCGLVSDVDQRLADLAEMKELLHNTTKPILAWASDMENWQDILEMFETVAGGKEKLAAKPNMMCLVACIDPLTYPADTVEEILFNARNGIPMTCSGGPMPGGTAPATMAGGLVIALADAMIGLVISQCARPGAPIILGGLLDGVDARSMSVSCSAPEFTMGQAAAADFYRYIGLPCFMHIGATDSPVLDEQAAFDVGMQLYTGALSAPSMNMFVGYLESCMSGSLETLVFGNEAIRYAEYMTGGFEISEETLALDLIDELGPGGTYIAEEHTVEHCRDYWSSPLFTHESYEDWTLNHKKTMGIRLHERVDAILEKGCTCPLPKDVAEKIDAIYERAVKRILG